MLTYRQRRKQEEGALHEKLKIPGEYCGPCAAAARFIAAIILLEGSGLAAIA